MIRFRTLLLPLLIAFALPACSAGTTPRAGTAVIVVNAPFSRSGTLATIIERGAILAAEQINASGGITVGDKAVKLEIKRLDSDLSPTRSASNYREAVAMGAVAIVDEGIGVDASWRIARDAGIPVGIVYQGGESLLDLKQRPNVFRIAPANRGIAFRLAEYLVPKGLRVAIVHDDGPYGSGGAESLARAFKRNPEAVAATIRVPGGATDLAPQILQARNAGATALVVWARPPIIALALRAARASGWAVPVFTPPAGADALVRQQMADHPEWIEGMTVAVGRMTAEVGPGPFEAFRSAYEKRFGQELVGVTSNGKQVVQLPEPAMYPYDFVHVVAAAMRSAKAARGSRELVAAMEKVAVQGANGDQRGFNANNHEGVVDDDVFFAAVRSMILVPVKDDALSATLPTLPQTR